ncbi:MAG: hypothetical protein R3C44_13660 [Chloroflexota bacterium]
MKANSVQELMSHLAGAIEVQEDTVSVVDEAALRNKMDDLVYTAVFGEGLTRDTARWLIIAAGRPGHIPRFNP